MLRERIGSARRGDAGPLPRAYDQVGCKCLCNEGETQTSEDLIDPSKDFEDTGEERPDRPANHSCDHGQNDEQPDRSVDSAGYVACSDGSGDHLPFHADVPESSGVGDAVSYTHLTLPTIYS